MFDKAKFEAGLKKDFNAIAKKVVDRALEHTVDELMYRSAVGQPDKWGMTPEPDYRPGEYKANWIHSTESPVYIALEDARDDSFQEKDCVTGRFLKSQIKANTKLYTTHYFTNNSDHALEVEHGTAIHNPQALTNIPHAVAGLTANTVPEFLRKAKQEILK